MRGLKIAVTVMSLLIVLGVLVIAVTIVRRVAGPRPEAMAQSVLLDEPAGTRIATITALPDRLAVLLQGGGTDRVLLLDAHTGQVLGRVALAR